MVNPFKSHKGIETLHPYVPGKSVEELQQEKGLQQVCKMASNENPLGCSRKVLDSLAQLASSTIAEYPAIHQHPLRQDLASHLRVRQEQIILANGSDAIFSLLMTCFALHLNKHILTHQYAFISYPIQAQTLGIPVIQVSVTRDFAVDLATMAETCNEHTAIIFLANPNNPTGISIENKEIENFLQQVPPKTIVVIDEAYIEYAESMGHVSVLPLLDNYPNLVITRTFSKAYGLAGLRCGYAIASAEMIAMLQRAQLPFPLSQAALYAAQSALQDQQFIKKSIATNLAGMAQIKKGLEKLGLPTLPSRGNFLCFRCPGNAAPLYEDLLSHGIIVRPLAPYGLAKHLRVSIDKKENNERFLTALAECLARKKYE